VRVSLHLSLLLHLSLPLSLVQCSRTPGLLVRLRRPSVVPSAWSLGWWIEGLRPRRWDAGGLLLSRESQAEACLPGEPGIGIVWGATRARVVDPAQCRGRHARGRPLSRGPIEATLRSRDQSTTAGPCSPLREKLRRPRRWGRLGGRGGWKPGYRGPIRLPAPWRGPPNPPPTRSSRSVTWACCSGVSTSHA